MADIARVPEPNNTPSPARFAHCVMRTNDLDAMRAWYTTVLGAETMFANERIVFLTYDDEHHRIAFIRREGLEPPVTGHVGLDHIAYAFDTLADLVGAYERLKAAGIVPRHCVNHGLTTSMYYADPDGNGVELQVDNFRGKEDLNAWFAEGAFNRNQMGADVDMDDIARRLHEGVPESELLKPWTETVEA